MEPVDTELERVVRRWQQLPLDRALLAFPGVRDLVQLLADDTAGVTGRGIVPVPDLGPAVVMDQLRVMVHDWRQAGLDEGVLEERLTRLRRTLP
ncbi:hypothetical protein [Ornithinimicrobium sufpigmenti]|uniref:hypothetical protein n=1 Tax=Ornithinimicrobium sufpigmenti TaxID=2508882 RepID=UPI0010358216|nr:MULTISPECIES: hypothetical protein [unclassified Ornithinimicrobium]